MCTSCVFYPCASHYSIGRASNQDVDNFRDDRNRDDDVCSSLCASFAIYSLPKGCFACHDTQAFETSHNHTHRPFTMSTAQEKKQAFIEHRVITDVLPGSIDLSYDLLVKWPNATLDTAGTELDCEDTQSQPTLYLSPAVSYREIYLQCVRADFNEHSHWSF